MPSHYQENPELSTLNCATIELNEKFKSAIHIMELTNSTRPEKCAKYVDKKFALSQRSEKTHAVYGWDESEGGNDK